MKKKDAKKEAKKLAQFMGEGWTAHVEHNIWDGHYYWVENGSLSICPSDHPVDQYQAYLGISPLMGNEDLGGGTADHKNPRKACKLLIEKAQRDQARRQVYIDEAIEAIRKK